MNRAELINDIAARAGLPKRSATAFVDAYEASILDALERGDRVYLHNFMRIGRKKKKAHGYDFKNKRTISSSERETIGVELGRAFSRLLDKTTES